MGQTRILFDQRTRPHCVKFKNVKYIVNVRQAKVLTVLTILELQLL